MTAADTIPAGTGGDAPPAAPDWRVAGLALALLVGGAAYVASAASGRHAALYLLGAALGLVLYHAAFGFASGWRAFVAEGRGSRAKSLPGVKVIDRIIATSFHHAIFLRFSRVGGTNIDVALRL